MMKAIITDGLSSELNCLINGPAICTVASLTTRTKAAQTYSAVFYSNSALSRIN